MNKDKQNLNANHNCVIKNFPLLENPEHFGLLLSRGKNYRKRLFERLNTHFPVDKPAYNTWKNRYLYPTKFVVTKQEILYPIMQEHLAFTLQEQADDLTRQIKEHSKTAIELNTIVEKIETTLKLKYNGQL